MKYIVYLTINKVNNKIYIGVHNINNSEYDYYLGCGAYSNKPSSYNKGKTAFHNAILKYGVNNFYRITLKSFNTRDEALKYEADLVDLDFIKCKNNYNSILGGGYPPNHTKKIYQYDLNGNFIKEWESSKTISNAFDKYDDYIKEVIYNKRSFNDSYWTYDLLDKIDISKFRMSYKGRVYQYNENGILLNSFKNANDACIKLDINESSIISAICTSHKLQNYYFTSEDKDINQILLDRQNRVYTNTTTIYQYDLEGNYIKTFNSIKSVKLDILNANHGNIIRAIKSKKKASNFFWSYYKVDNILLEDVDLIKESPKKIHQYDLQNNLIKVWDNSFECRKEFPNYIRVCRGERKHTQNFIFKYS